MKTATTVFELAKILKVSPSTISRALKNHPNIAPETKQRVLELARKMDYEPNLFAVGLRTSNTRELAVIVPTLSGFFYDSFISAVEEEAARVGYSTFILLSGDNPEIEKENIKVCKQRKVEGVFACLTSRTSDVMPFQRLRELKMPLVFFDKVPLQGNFNMVCAPDEQAADMAALALIKSNRNSILSLFGDMNMSISSRRHDAYLKTFHETKPGQSLRIDYATSFERAIEIVLRVFSEERKPDAIFCMSDEILIGVMKAIQILQLKVPHDVGVIAISNGFFPKLYHPEITYVETSGNKLGKAAFERMMAVLQGDQNSKELILKSVLVAGGSL